MVTGAEVYATVGSCPAADAGIDAPAACVVTDIPGNATERGDVLLFSTDLDHVGVFQDELGFGTVSITDLGPSSVTPEPSSLALLGTGLLGVTGVIKRRIA